MDISDNDGKEICHSAKKAKTSDESKDFISELPDQILVHILSFLPIKDAINTVLLRRFGDLWQGIQVLDFNSCLHHDCEDDDRTPDGFNENFVELIRRVLNLHDGSTLDKLCLKFGFSLYYSNDEEFSNGFDEGLEWEKGTADQIERLIRYAISRKVKVLDLNLKGCVEVSLSELYELPDVLSSDYLTCLKLTAFDITSCETIDLKSLRVLLLQEVSLSDEIMKDVFVGCPLLETLCLIDCYGLGLLSCKNPNLKKVMLTLNGWEDAHVIISCPYVLSLEIYGWIERAFLFNVSSVVDASIFYSYFFKYEKKGYTGVSTLLQNLSQCKTFSACTWSILVLTMWKLANYRCPSFEWKNLILKLNLTKWHHHGLSLLLKNSQSLETVTMHISPGSADIFTRNVPELIRVQQFRENYWDSQEATFPCLETVMIYGYVNEPCVIQMVKFLLKSAIKLQKLVISTKESFKPTHEIWLIEDPIEKPQFTSEQLQQLSQKFRSLHRASPEATIYFS